MLGYRQAGTDSGRVRAGAARSSVGPGGARFPSQGEAGRYGQNKVQSPELHPFPASAPAWCLHCMLVEPHPSILIVHGVLVHCRDADAASEQV